MKTPVTETTYVYPLDEGVDVWRPVQASRMAGGVFQIISKNGDPEDEHWQFHSGSLVRCEERQLSGGTHLVAVELVAPPSLKVVPNGHR